MSSADDSAATPQPQSVSTPAGPVGGEERSFLDFVVVGVGASAGGIEALSAFLKACPIDSGLALVVIQHLPPDSKSYMSEILGRCTAMRVLAVEQGLPVLPNSVYVTRPGFTVTIENGKLRLGEPVQERGHRHPVDDFFRSLATEQKDKAIVVVLSGTGTNGTAGAQAIKAAGGLCIAQDPETAEFPGMPRSLIRSGYADQILPPEEIGPFLAEYSGHPAFRVRSPEPAPPEAQFQIERRALGEVHALLRTRTGHDFRGYRRPTLMRRIQRRMGVSGTEDLAEYAAFLRVNPDEATSLANDLMINVTGFFRDPEAWEALRATVVTPLVETRPANEPIRAWVAACSSGEEPYSLAMLLAEECDRLRRDIEIKIFATDTADKSLSFARAGVYPGGIEGDIPQARLERFFERDEHTYRIKKEIRDMVVFAPQNLLRDPPFSRVDIAICRNLLIYLEPETQQRVVAMLTFSVRDGGHLFLGNTENLGSAEQYFETLSKRWRIFHRVGPLQHRMVDMPFAPLALQAAISERDASTSRVAPVHEGETRRPFLYERALLEEFSPPTVVVDRLDRMLYITGDLSPFLTHAAGEQSSSIIDAARAPVRGAVRAALRQVAQTHVTVSIECSADEGEGSHRIRVTASPLKSRLAGRNLRVSFELLESSTRPRDFLPAAAQAIHPLVPTDSVLEDEIRILRRELQASLESFEASNEELKSSNEEVLSVNEELQSANEELETSKEELQSLNEELSTVNLQLQTKLAELEQTTDDLSNLLSSTSIAVVFLDTQLLVRRFTPAVSDLLELIPTDIGRPLSNLAPKFSTRSGQSPHEALQASAKAVFDQLAPVETELQSHSGKWYLQRTLPYRTQDNHIDGVVFTFIDITARRQAEAALEAVRARLEAAVEHTPAALVIADAVTARIAHANRRAAALFGQPYPPNFLNVGWGNALATLKGHRRDGQKLGTQDWPLARTLATGEAITDEVVEMTTERGQRRTLLVSAAPVTSPTGEMVSAVGAFWDVTDITARDAALAASEQKLRLIIDSAREFAIIMTDPQGMVTTWNAGAYQVFGWLDSEILGQSADLLFTPEDRRAHVPAQEMLTALQTGRASDERFHIRKDGKLFWASGAMSVARDEHGEVQGFVKVLRDQSEQKAAETRIAAATRAATEAKEQAEAANRAKDDFISTVSHELRTPLHTMRLSLRLLTRKASSGEDFSQSTLVLEKALDAQQQMIDDLLDVSRIAAGKLRVDIRATPLEETVRLAVESLRPIAVRKGIELKYDADGEVGIVRADPDRIQQVVWNLLSNAIKFTPSGGTVTVQLFREKHEVMLRVTDTGIGIRADLLPQIFARFQQGESGTARQHTGLGLGLTIAQELVQLHDGKITVSSEGQGTGTSVLVSLPMPQVSGSFDQEIDAAPVDVSGALAGLRILLVEDEESTRDVARRSLEAVGAHVLAVESAAAAIEAYKLQRPQLIVSDIGLPGEDGYVLIQQVRQLEAERRIASVPSIALTAFARSEDRQRALTAGYDAHVAKPVNPEKLFEEIARLHSRQK